MMYCKRCGDSIVLDFKLRVCDCGYCYGSYLYPKENGRAIFYEFKKNTLYVVGINNDFLAGKKRIRKLRNTKTRGNNLIHMVRPIKKNFNKTDRKLYRTFSQFIKTYNKSFDILYINKKESYFQPSFFRSSH